LVPLEWKDGRIVELELSRRAPHAPGTLRQRLIRPGLWLQWGTVRLPVREVLPPDEATGTLCFAYLLEGGWYESFHPGPTELARPAGGMALIRGDALRACLPQPGTAFHVTLLITPAALDLLLSGDTSVGAATVQQVAGHAGPPELSLPLTTAARFAAESIRRCPFAGTSRGLALEARCNDMLAEFITALDTLARPGLPAPRLPLRETQEQVQAAAAVLLQDLEHPPSLAALARTVGLSESTLKRSFRQVYGTTPFGYLRARRMEAARTLLEKGEATVIEAAAFVGYSNPSNFAAAFRRQFGLNPKTFQLKSRG
jgi:AraC-like DNA-binding protein